MSREEMMKYLWDLPAQFEWAMSEAGRIPNIKGNIKNIVVAGMGGSAIGGDILRCLMLSQGQVPVIVNRGYNIPAFVDAQTLFLVVSYSGNTEETLSAYEQARQCQAQIVCFCSGGRLEEMAVQNEHPVFKIPGGLVPRAATGYLFAPLALLVEKAGLLKGISEDLKETVDVLYQLRAELNPEVTMENNLALSLATRMRYSLPLIWGTESMTETTAFRWKAQINENAKCPAYYAVFPELNHNEIVGFEVPDKLIEQLFVVILRDSQDHPRVQKRIKITSDLIRTKVKELVEINSRGSSWLARFYSLVYIGDYTSTYLALEYDLDPIEIKAIDYLKNTLAK